MRRIGQIGLIGLVILTGGCVVFETTLGGIVKTTVDVSLQEPSWMTEDTPSDPLAPLPCSATNLVVSDEVAE